MTPLVGVEVIIRFARLSDDTPNREAEDALEAFINQPDVQEHLIFHVMEELARIYPEKPSKPIDLTEYQKSLITPKNIYAIIAKEKA